MIHAQRCVRCGHPAAPPHSLCASCRERLPDNGEIADANLHAPLVAALPARLFCWDVDFDEYTLTLRPGDPVIATDVLSRFGVVFLLHLPTGLRLWARLDAWMSATGQRDAARR